MPFILKAALELTRSQMLERFLKTKARSSQMGSADPLASGEEESKPSSRIAKYDMRRDATDSDTTSRPRSVYSLHYTCALMCVEVLIYRQE